MKEEIVRLINLINDGWKVWSYGTTENGTNVVILEKRYEYDDGYASHSVCSLVVDPEGNVDIIA